MKRLLDLIKNLFAASREPSGTAPASSPTAREISAEEYTAEILKLPYPQIESVAIFLREPNPEAEGRDTSSYFDKSIQLEPFQPLLKLGFIKIEADDCGGHRVNYNSAAIRKIVARPELLMEIWAKARSLKKAKKL